MCTYVVEVCDVVEVGGFSESRHLVELAQVRPQVLVVDHSLLVALCKTEQVSGGINVTQVDVTQEIHLN